MAKLSELGGFLGFKLRACYNTVVLGFELRALLFSLLSPRQSNAKVAGHHTNYTKQKGKEADKQ